MQFNCEVAAKVLQLNLAKKTRFLYLNTLHTRKSIKNLLIYEKKHTKQVSELAVSNLVKHAQQT
ncbi:2354_t:CDS:1, partial [Racocetra persica]